MASSEAVAIRPGGTARDLQEVVAEAVVEHRDCVRREFAAELAATFTAMRPRAVDGQGERVMDDTLQMVVRTILRLAGIPEVG